MKMFCQDCGHEVEVIDSEETVLKNGTSAYKGHCPDCGSELYKRRK